MQLLTKALLKKLPKLYSQENVKDPLCVVKFFNPTGVGTWYGIEYDPEEKLFFGYAKISDAELGYFSLIDLESFKGPFGLGIERDLYFKPTRLSKIKKELNS
jgi:hypothetical protein